MTKRFTTTVEVTNEKGLHLHVAGLIAKAASQFRSDIWFSKDDLKANGKSVLSLTLLAARKGTRLTLTAEGEDAEEAVRRLAELFAKGFGVE